MKKIYSLITIALFVIVLDGRAYNNTLTATNIAELQSMSVPSLIAAGYSNIAVFVRGYYTDGDRGGGMFLWDPNSSGTPDGGRYITTNGWISGNGRWVRQLNGETANVKMWGAKGDNSHDDTISIQNAATACSWGWTMELLFPSGQYLVTNTILFGCTLRGEGGGNNTMIRLGADKDLFCTQNAHSALTGGAIDWDHWITIENFYIDLGSTSVTNSAFVLCQPGEANTLRNLTILNGGYGIRIFGSGAPGLKLWQVHVSDQAVAGISIEGYLPNGTWIGGGGSTTLIGLSGDHRRDNSNGTASLVKVDRCYPGITMTDFKAEGQWGGGLVQYKWGDNDTNPYDTLGYLNIAGGTYNCGGISNIDCDLIVLQSAAYRTVPVYIQPLSLYGVRYLIRDDLNKRNVLPDTQLGSGADQTTCRLPVQYEGVTQKTRLVVGETDRCDIYSSQTNVWFRVMSNLINHMGGRLVISTWEESSDIGFDVVPGVASSGALLTVNRASLDTGGTYPPHVTKARAGSYYDPSLGGNVAFLDIYLQRTLGDNENIALAHPLEGNIFRGPGAFLFGYNDRKHYLRCSPRTRRHLHRRPDNPGNAFLPTISPRPIRLIGPIHPIRFDGLGTPNTPLGLGGQLDMNKTFVALRESDVVAPSDM